MSQPEPYEDVVLGSGIGGKLLAGDLGRSGRRVAVVERRYYSGNKEDHSMSGERRA